MSNRTRLILVFLVTSICYGVGIFVSASILNFDTDSYRIIGALTIHGKNIYPDPAISRHPYLPLFLYAEAGTLFLSQITGVSQVILIKILLMVFHLISVALIYRLSGRKIRTALLYALNPVSLLIISIHGQFDVIPLTLILTAVSMVKEKKYIPTLMFLSSAIALKTWPILFIAPFLKRISHNQWWKIGVVPLVSLFVYVIAFGASAFSILRVLLVYQGVGGIWGLGMLLQAVHLGKYAAIGVKVFVVGVFILYSYRLKKTNITEELFHLILLFLVITPGFGIQWLIWIVPFIFLSPKPFSKMFIIPLSILLAVVYASWFPHSLISRSGTRLAVSALYPLFPLFLLFRTRRIALH